MTGGDPDDGAKSREHLANERTLLAWVRTAIALMALGFVVARFGLFLKEIAVQAGRRVQGTSYAQPIGITLVSLGVLTTIVSAVGFFRTRRQISEGTFRPSLLTEAGAVAGTLLAGAALITYLAVSSTP